jgi:hypothetical protein
MHQWQHRLVQPMLRNRRLLRLHPPWWEALESVYQREKIVWRLFVGSQPTPEQNKLYSKFREMLVQGSRLRANA